MSVKKVNELNEAIKKVNYEKVEAMLADPEVPVNLGSSRYFCCKLPLECMLESGDAKMARLFLNCPRIDWLAPTWPRNLSNLDASLGIEFEFLHSVPSHDPFGYFYHLEKSFIQKCPEEAELIYEKIIAEIVRVSESQNLDKLLLYACDNLISFKIALKYSKNIGIENESGQTLLHITNDAQVAEILIKMGGDVVALDNKEWTPLMAQSDKDRLEVMAVLVRHGADIEFINSKQQSAFGLCCQLSRFLKHFPISDAAFMNKLSSGKRIHFKYNMPAVFEKYPRFEALFTTNLPLHLTLFYDFDETKYFATLNDTDRLGLIKVLIQKLYHFNILSFKKEFVESHADELLHYSASANNRSCTEALLLRCKADPNCIINGKAPLFVAKPDVWNIVLKNGSDPLLECDGLNFFERTYLWQNVTVVDATWMITLFKKGFDMFVAHSRTGKALINYLDHEAQLDVKVRDCNFLFPVSKVTPGFFEAISGDILDPFMPIDQDNNTLLHYFAPNSKGNFRIFKNAKIPALEQLKLIKNNSGTSVYELIIKHDKIADFASRIVDFSDLNSYASDFLALHDIDLYTKFGAKLVKSQFESTRNYAFADYLITEKKISINRICGYCTLGQWILNRQSRIDEGDLAFVLRHGYKLAPRDCIKLMRANHFDVLTNYLDECDNVNEIIKLFTYQKPDYQAAPLPFNDAIRAFFAHKKVLGAVPGWDQSVCCTTLDQYFFILIENIYSEADDADEVIKYLLGLGVDTRKLIGSGLTVEIDFYEDSSSPSCSRKLIILREAGWTLSDFQNLLVADFGPGFSLYEFFITYFPQDFIQVFGGPIVLTTVPEAVVCPECKGNLEAGNEAYQLDCGHYLHCQCSQEFFANRFRCPYC